MFWCFAKSILCAMSLYLKDPPYFFMIFIEFVPFFTHIALAGVFNGCIFFLISDKCSASWYLATKLITELLYMVI